MVNNPPSPSRLEFSERATHGKIILNIVPTGAAKKLDSLGRITIPIRLRERLNLAEGQIYNFVVIEEEDKTYLGIECDPDVKADIEAALKTLRKNGLKITVETE